MQAPLLALGRKIAGAIIRTDGLFYNWTTTGWEPWDYTKHLKPWVSYPIDPKVDPTGIFKDLMNADISDVLLQRSDIALLIISLNGDGTPIQPIDVWTYPNPVSNPVIGGFLRMI